MQEVFAKGQVLKKYPFIVRYLAYDFKDNYPLKVVVSVPKRRIKKATARNRVRRQIKEAYRLNKSNLIDELRKADKGLALFFIYTGKENPEYSIIQEKIKLLLKDLEELSLNDNPTVNADNKRNTNEKS